MTDAIVEAVAGAIAQHLAFNSTDDVERAARAAIAAYEREGWRPIAEAENDVQVLTWDAAHGIRLMTPDEQGWWASMDDMEAYAVVHESREPTHFRPLPSPPQEGQ